jgi:hypothetical protein
MSMLERSLAPTAAAAALALAACGTDRCPMETAYVDEATVPASCTELSTTYSFTIGLCEDCRYTSPSCEADVLSVPAGGRPGEVFLATQWQVCADDQGCPFQSGEDCWFPTCVVTVPQGGPYDVYYVVGTDLNGDFVTGAFQIEFGAPGDTCG